MFLVVNKQPIIQVLCAGINDGVLGVQDVVVSKHLGEQPVLHAVFKQELSQAVFVAKPHVGQVIHVHGFFPNTSSRSRT